MALFASCNVLETCVEVCYCLFYASPTHNTSFLKILSFCIYHQPSLKFQALLLYVGREVALKLCYCLCCTNTYLSTHFLGIFRSPYSAPQLTPFHASSLKRIPLLRKLCPGSVSEHLHSSRLQPSITPHHKRSLLTRFFILGTTDNFFRSWLHTYPLVLYATGAGIVQSRNVQTTTLGVSRQSQSRQSLGSSSNHIIIRPRNWQMPLKS